MAQEGTPFSPNPAEKKSRADVRAQLAQAGADGTLPVAGETTYEPVVVSLGRHALAMTSAAKATTRLASTASTSSMPAEQNGSHAVRAAAFRRTHAIEKD
jgi:hypothetical protein